MSALLAQLVGRLGPWAGLVGYYLRLSGLPIPVAEHAFPVYLGHQFASSSLALAAVWLGLIALSVAGASNLYLAGRLWGRSMLHGAVGRGLGVDSERAERVERWYRRWGWAAVMVGVHVPGLRVPVLLLAGALGTRYPVFAVSVAVTMAPRLALALWVGVNFGSRIADYLAGHVWVYTVGSALVVLALIGVGWRVWVGLGRGAASPQPR